MYETSSITPNISYLNIALSKTYEETTVITGLAWFNCMTLKNPSFNELKITNKTILKLILKTSTLTTLSCKNQIHPRENRNRKANKVDRNRVVQVRVGFIYKVCAASTCSQTPFEQSASL